MSARGGSPRRPPLTRVLYTRLRLAVAALTSGLTGVVRCYVSDAKRRTASVSEGEAIAALLLVFPLVHCAYILARDGFGMGTKEARLLASRIATLFLSSIMKSAPERLSERLIEELDKQPDHLLHLYA